MSSIIETSSRPVAMMSSAETVTGAHSIEEIISESDAPTLFGALMTSLSQKEPEHQDELAKDENEHANGEGGAAAASNLPIRSDLQEGMSDALERAMWPEWAETTQLQGATKWLHAEPAADEGQKVFAAEAQQLVADGHDGDADSIVEHGVATSSRKAQSGTSRLEASSLQRGVTSLKQQPVQQDVLEDDTISVDGAVDDDDNGHTLPLVRVADKRSSARPEQQGEDLTAWQRAADTQSFLQVASSPQAPPSPEPLHPQQVAQHFSAAQSGNSTTNKSIAQKLTADADPSSQGPAPSVGGPDDGQQREVEAGRALPIGVLPKAQQFDAGDGDTGDDDGDSDSGHPRDDGQHKASFFPVGMMPHEGAVAALQPPKADTRGADSQYPQERDTAVYDQVHPRLEKQVNLAEGEEKKTAAVSPPAERFAQVLQGAAAQPTTVSQALAQEPAVAAPIPAVAVSEELSSAISQGFNRIQMRVVPEGMGELDIKVQMTGKQVHLTIRGDAPELAQLLSSKVHELRQDLRDQGLSLEAMDYGALHTGSQETGAGQDGLAQRFAQEQGQSGRDFEESGGLQRLAHGSSEITLSEQMPTKRFRKNRIIDVIL